MTADFRKFIKREFRKRQKTNTRYSLRAFARSLKIHNSLLSRIINGSVPITEKTLLKIASRLKVSEKDFQIFKLSVIAKKRRKYKKIDA